LFVTTHTEVISYCCLLIAISISISLGIDICADTTILNRCIYFEI